MSMETKIMVYEKCQNIEDKLDIFLCELLKLESKGQI